MVFRASMEELVLLPKPSISLTICCVALYICVGATALYRSVIPSPLPISRLKIFQYLVAAFSFIRSLAFITEDPAARDVINRLALCIFFSLVLFQVFFWLDIVNPAMSVRSKRIWNAYIGVNLIFYLFVLVLQLLSPPPTPELDDDSRVRVSFWSDLLPVLLVALGSLASSAGMFYLSCKMRIRVQRLVDEADSSLSQQIIGTMYRALSFLNAVLLISSLLFAMRTVFYMQRPWSHKECGAIQDPNVCILIGYVLPEIVPSVLFLVLMWKVDPQLWTTRLTTTETTPLLRKQNSTFETQNEMWHRPFKSPHFSLKRPSTPSPRNAIPWDAQTNEAKPGFWLSFQCFQLKCPGDVHSSFVVLCDKSGKEIGRTDIAHTTNPVYHVMLKVPQGIQVNIRIYAIRNMNSIHDLSTQWVVGDTVWLPQNASVGRAQLYRLHEHDPQMAGLLVVRCEAPVQIDTPQHLTRAFIIQDTPKLLIEEELVESPFTWEIPYQLLQVIVADLTHKLDHLRLALDLKIASSPLDASQTSSLLSDMIYHLQGNKRRRTNHKWRVEMIQLMETYLQQVQDALVQYKSHKSSQLTFKPSTKKADPELRFLALNLHAQMMTLGAAVPDDEYAKEAGWADDAVQKISLQDIPSFRNHRLLGTVTVGAFAAHVYGFSHGGVRQLRDSWDRLREQSQNAVGTDLTVLQRDMHALEWEIDQRLDVAFSQAVTALITSFQQTLYTQFHALQTTNPSHPSIYFDQIRQHGFLFNVESLLSTVGSEAGMLGDMDAAVKALAHVTIQLHVVPCATFSVSIISHGSDGLTIELPLLADDVTFATTPMMHRIPGQDKSTGAVYLPRSMVLEVGSRINIRVIPVLFNQGMNEVQTVANTVGRSQLQEEINEESAEVLEAYLASISTTPEVMEVWDHVKTKISEAKAEKVMDIVAMTSWIARQVGGGRVTCCKSAKDRTAMSVTLEEAQWMNESREDQSMWTQLLRTYGVRRENARKNIGTAQYSFNVWQNYMLPSDYKCPPGTGGGGQS